MGHVEDGAGQLRAPKEAQSVSAVVGKPCLMRLTGISSLRNMATPFRVSMRATFCGVDTITEPASKNSGSPKMSKEAWQVRTGTKPYRPR